MPPSALAIGIAAGFVAGAAIAFFALAILRKRRAARSPGRVSLRSVLDRDPDGLIVIDAEGRRLYSNPAAAAMLGDAVAEAKVDVPGLLAERLGYADGLAADRDALSDAIRPSEQQQHAMHGPLQLPDSRWLRISSTRIPTLDPEAVEYSLRLHDLSDWQRADSELRQRGDALELGIEQRASQLEAAVATLRREVDHRRAVETELRSSKERYRMISKLSSDLSFSFTVDTGGRLHWEWITPLVTKLTGYDFDELLAIGWRGTVHPDDVETIDLLRAPLLSGEPVDAEFRIVTKSGDTRWLESHTIARRDEETGSMRAIGALRDVSERKRADEAEHRQARQHHESQRLESLGVLAGGIAHDFNNLLAVIAGNTELAASELDSPELLAHRLERIRSAADYAVALTDQILTYAGRSTLEVSVISIERIISGMLELLTASVARNCLIRTEFARNLPPVEGDAVQIRQVIMNLVTNAAESLGDRGGNIVVRTRVVRGDAVVDQDFHGIGTPPGGELVCIEVQDDGPGIAAENRSRVFEPFFSTRFSGRGLGLAAVHGIVHAHGGVIRLRSDPDRETVFQVLLPRSEKEYAAVRSREPAKPSAPKEIQGKCVLVVDDDDAVREIASTFLERSGFRVQCAQGGIEALKIFEAHRDAIDVVVLDLSMPDIDGRRTFERIRCICDATPVILVSGYSEEQVAERFASGAKAVDFLAKPYTEDELVARIRRSLGD